MTKRIFNLIFLFTFSSLAYCQINTERVISIGRNALYFEDYVLSIQYFNQVINAKPYLAEPYFFRGLAKMNLDDFRGAEEDCTKSLERNPFVADTYQIRGISRIRQNNLDGAIEDYEKALSFEPENINVWHNIALCRIQKKDYVEAKKDIDKLISLSPRNTKAYLMRADVNLKQKDTLQAEHDYDMALSIDKYDADVWAGKAMISLAREKFKEAELNLNEAIKLSVHNSGMYINRALARFRQNNLRGAMSDYDLALDIDPNSFIGHYNRGLLRARVGDDNRAIEDFNFVIKVDPDDMIALFNRAILLDKVGELSKAEKDYTSVIKTYPNFLVGYQNRAKVRRKLGNLKGAEEDEMKVFKAELDKTYGTKNNKQQAQGKNTRKKSDKNIDNFNRIVVADNEDDDEKYKSQYRGRVQDKKTEVSLQPMFCLTYYKKYDEVKQLVTYNKVIDNINSKKLLPQRLLITNEEAPLSESQIKRHFASVNDLTSLIVANSNDVYKRFARAIDFYLVQDFTNALKDLDKVIEIDNSFFSAYFMRGLIHYKQIEYSNVSDKFVDESNKEKMIIKSLDYEKVKKDFEKVIEIAPNFLYAYYNLANVNVLMKDYHSAIVGYDKAIKLDNNFADAYYNRGLTYIYLGNKEKGVKDLSKAGELGIFSAYNIIKRYTDIKQ